MSSAPLVRGATRRGDEGGESTEGVARGWAAMLAGARCDWSTRNPTSVQPPAGLRREGQHIVAPFVQKPPCRTSKRESRVMMVIVIGAGT